MWSLAVVFVISRHHIDAILIWHFVCPSVCLSVCPYIRYVSVLCGNGLTYCYLFSSHGSPIILYLSVSNSSAKFRQGHPFGGAKYRWGIKISRFATNKSLHLANDTRQRHNYYRKRIGIRTQAFEWNQFQWPLVTCNPVFKVTILLNVK